MIASVIAALRGDRTELDTASLTTAFLVMLATLPAYGVIAFSVETVRADLLDREMVQIPWAAFGTVMLAHSLAFPVVATLMATVFGKPERVRGWIILRHWAVFAVAWVLAALWALTFVGLPHTIANFATFAGMFVVLGLDIRLAQTAGGFSLGAAVLIGSVIATLGLTFLLAGMQYYLG